LRRYMKILIFLLKRRIYPLREVSILLQVPCSGRPRHIVVDVFRPASRFVIPALRQSPAAVFSDCPPSTATAIGVPSFWIFA
jgi:hypothetical protein